MLWRLCLKAELMATLLAEFLPDISFQELVGLPMPADHCSERRSAECKATEAEGINRCDAPMRIHLPDGAVREMTLAQYREFLVSYQITHIRTSELPGTDHATCCVTSDDRRVRSTKDIDS